MYGLVGVCLCEALNFFLLSGSECGVLRPNVPLFEDKG